MSGRLLCVFVTLCSFQASAFAAEAPAPAVPVAIRQPGWHRFGAWRQTEGLPQDSIFTVIQSRDGYLWIGTKGGLARFDGVRFTTFDDRDRRQLRDNEVWSITEDADGSIWAGTYGGGVSRYRNGKLEVLTSAQGLISDYIGVVCSDRKGAVFLGTDRGLSVFKDGRFTNFDEGKGLPGNVVRGLYADPDGSVWIGTNTGEVARYKDGRIEAVRFTGPTITNEVRWFWRAPDGALWIATYEGLARVAHDHLTLYTTADGLWGDRVRQITPGEGGDVWVSSNYGIDRMRWDGARPTFEHVAGGFSVMAFCVDREGSVWLGTFLEGLVRLRRGFFATYSREDGLSDLYVGAVIEDRQGAIWAGPRNSLCRIEGGRIETYGEDSGLPPKATIYTLLEDADLRFWVGTDAGVYRSIATPACSGPGGRPRFRALRHPSIPRLYARVFLEDRAGGVWIGLDQQGLVYCRKDKLTTYTVEDGLANNSVRALAQDREGALWIGTRGGGLCRFQDGRFRTYTEADGLAGTGVQALYIEPDDTLWVATRQGISRLKNGHFTTFTVNQGLFVNYAYSFVDDRLGYLWMGSAKGVFRVPKRDFDDVAAGRLTAVRSEAYGVEHGLRSQPVAGSDSAACRGRDGRLWFATNAGLSVVDPSQIVRNTQPPPVNIEAVIANGVARDLAETVEVPAGRGNVSFRYTALSFLAPPKMRFKYRLEGYDPDWVDAETRRVAYYTNIPPGQYRFRVIASNNEGVWNETGAAVRLRLLPHFYQTYWFYALCVLAIATLGAATQRLRVLQLQARERALSVRVDEALAQVKTLRGMLPICASCKKIRDDNGYWNLLETYLHEHSEADFSHGICPDCVGKLYPEYAGERPRKKAY